MGLNRPDKCEDYLSLSSEDFSDCKTYWIYKMRDGPLSTERRTVDRSFSIQNLTTIISLFGI